jgi:hypothetical protein
MCCNFNALFDHERELVLEVLRERMRKEFVLAAESLGEGSFTGSASFLHARRIQRLLETLNPKNSTAFPNFCSPGTNHEAAKTPVTTCSTHYVFSRHC